MSSIRPYDMCACELTEFGAELSDVSLSKQCPPFFVSSLTYFIFSD